VVSELKLRVSGVAIARNVGRAAARPGRKRRL